MSTKHSQIANLLANTLHHLCLSRRCISLSDTVIRLGGSLQSPVPSQLQRCLALSCRAVTGPGPGAGPAGCQRYSAPPCPVSGPSSTLECCTRALNSLSDPPGTRTSGHASSVGHILYESVPTYERVHSMGTFPVFISSSLMIRYKHKQLQFLLAQFDIDED